MEKFIPYEKLSKKEKRKIDQAKRQTWGELNPVTRKPENSKAYNRRKAQSWKRDSGSVPLFFKNGAMLPSDRPCYLRWYGLFRSHRPISHLQIADIPRDVFHTA